MIILIVAEETENTFIHNLSKALRENDCRVDIGIDKFWTSEEHFDIIHFHWPEHLSFKLIANHSSDSFSIAQYKKENKSMKQAGMAHSNPTQYRVPRISVGFSSLIFAKSRC